jgi:hypothetical protein
MPHHFLQIDDLTTGAISVIEYTEGDMAEVYPPELRALLARGETVRIADRLHLDLQAFVRAKRSLPWTMTRQPINLAARRAGVPQLQRA